MCIKKFDAEICFSKSYLLPSFIGKEAFLKKKKSQISGTA